MLDPKLAELCTNRFSLKQGSGSFLCMAKLPFRYAATGVLGDDTERTVLKLPVVPHKAVAEVSE